MTHGRPGGPTSPEPCSVTSSQGTYRPGCTIRTHGRYDARHRGGRPRDRLAGLSGHGGPWMRIHQPMPVLQALEGLLASPDVAEAVVARRILPARSADLVDIPGWLDPRLRGALARRGIPALYRHQAEAMERLAGGEDVARRDAHRLGQVAVLPPAGAAGRRRGSGRAGALPVPDQGAQPGPAGRGARAGRPRRAELEAGVYDGDTPAPHPQPHPCGRPGRGHQPGHAPRGDPAPPHEVVPALRAAALRGHRRGPRLPRHLRQPRRQRAAAARAHLRPLRLDARIICCSATIGQPRRARRRRSPAGRCGSSTATARRAARSTSWCSTRRSVDARTGVRPGSLRAGTSRRPDLPARRPPDHRLRALAGRGGAAPDDPARGAARGPWAHRPGARLSRRLPAHGAARHRGRPADGARSWASCQHQRARAGHRHRPARRRRAGGLSGHHRRDLAADGARRAPPGASAWPSWWPAPGALDQYVAATPEYLFEATAGGGAARPGERPRPAGAPARRHLRAAVRARRGVRRRGPRTTCWPSWPRRATSARPTTAAGTGRARTSRPPRSACAWRRRRTCSSSTPAPERPRVIGEVDLFSAPDARARERHLPPRVAPVPRRPARLGRAQGLRAAGRRRPLHPGGAGGHAQAARDVRGGAARARCGEPGPRRGDGVDDGHHLQEAQAGHATRTWAGGASTCPRWSCIPPPGGWRSMPRPPPAGGGTSSTRPWSVPAARSRRWPACCS